MRRRLHEEKVRCGEGWRRRLDVEKVGEEGWRRRLDEEKVG